MINFCIYIFSFATSIAVIFTAPEKYLKGYLGSYTLFSVFFSLLFFIFFRRYANRTTSILAITLLLCVFCVTALVSGPYYASLLFYPGILIFSDLAATQSLTTKRVNAYRFFLILTALHFFIYPENFQSNLIIRVLLLFIISLVLAIFASEMHKIHVKSPWKFMAGNYIFYNGILLMITYSGLKGNDLRYWFLSGQTGLVFILKYLDFSLRKSYDVSNYLKGMVYFFSLCAPLPVLIFLPNIYVLVIYYIGMVGLIFTSRYIDR